MRRNLTLLTDSYKLGHHQMYPDGTKHVYSYYESRKGSKFPYTVFFGLQYILKEYLEGRRVNFEDIEDGRTFCKAHFGFDGMFNYDMWKVILEKYEGRLPIEIRAVPEGTVVPTGNVLMTITNTDPRCAPLVNHLETLLCQIWYPCNVATLSREVKIVLADYLGKTSDSQAGLAFMLHDFGMRGVSSMESAGIGGAAHLVNFMGTDTVLATDYARRYYEAGSVTGFSVPASEHSVMTALGRDGEMDMVRRLIHKYPKGILSVVSDSYDIFAACEYYGTVLKDEILARDGVFVVRPDSGDPVKTVLRCLGILGKHFGSTTNSLGYMVLNPKVRMIWGDGVDIDDIATILRYMTDAGWSAENIVFGMGGGLLQKHNRDTQKFAFKASAINIDDTWRDVFKMPIDGSKGSKPGRLKLVTGVFGFETVPMTDMRTDILEPVFKDGKILRTQTFADIRAKAALQSTVLV